MCRTEEASCHAEDHFVASIFPYGVLGYSVPSITFLKMLRFYDALSTSLTLEMMILEDYFLFDAFASLSYMFVSASNAAQATMITTEVPIPEEAVAVAAAMIATNQVTRAQWGLKNDSRWLEIFFAIDVLK